MRPWTLPKALNSNGLTWLTPAGATASFEHIVFEQQGQPRWSAQDITHLRAKLHEGSSIFFRVLTDSNVLIVEPLIDSLHINYIQSDSVGALTSFCQVVCDLASISNHNRITAQTYNPAFARLAKRYGFTAVEQQDHIRLTKELSDGRRKE